MKNIILTKKEFYKIYIPFLMRKKFKVLNTGFVIKPFIYSVN